MNKVNLCWVISDGRKGHEIQSTTVADHIAHQVKLYTFQSTWIQRMTAPRALGHRLQETHWVDSHPDLTKPPQIIISCGRQAAAAAKTIKKQTGCKHIQILNPKGNLTDYDLLLLPKHDAVQGVNICCFTGSIHNIKPTTNPSKSNESIAVILGNPAKEYWETHWINDWTRIQNLANHISICGSPRLTQHAKSLIRMNAQIENVNIWLDNSDGENPYQKLLSEAGIFYVTADSINMVNECLATDKEVKLLATNLVQSRRHLSFIDSVTSHLSSRQKDETVLWPNPINEIISCTKLQNLLNSPSSFNKG